MPCPCIAPNGICSPVHTSAPTQPLASTAAKFLVRKDGTVYGRWVQRRTPVMAVVGMPRVQWQMCAAEKRHSEAGQGACCGVPPLCRPARLFPTLCRFGVRTLPSELVPQIEECLKLEQ